MQSYSLAHLDDASLMRRLLTCFGRERANTAVLIAHLAETDARRLYASAGYPSMHAWCVAEFGLSDDSAFKRITAARTARRFPAIFSLVAQGRLHLTAVRMLAPHLAPDNAEELLEAACGLSRDELEALLARRAAAAAPPTLPICDPVPTQHALVAQEVEAGSSTECQLAPGRVDPPLAQTAAGAVPTSLAAAPTTPTVWPEERVVLQIALPRRTHHDLRYLQSLLSHSIPSGDLAIVLGRAIQAAIREIERRKFGATDRPRAPRGTTSTSEAAPAARSIPAHVRRAVWLRDGGQCTFVSESGRVCGTRRFLEFDHVDPVARGGRATVETVRLRCHAHNQLEAERTYGRGFMERKREARTRRESDDACPRANGATHPSVEETAADGLRPDLS